MITDTHNRPTPVFSPRRIQAVEEDVAWTPGSDDRVFCCKADCTYKINGGTAVNLYDGDIRGIRAGLTYTFSVAQNLEVE